MPKTYNQNCSLAFALDLLGERWTLLIIRELLAGPRRFTDLMTNLPGIGPNLLTKRLNELKNAGLLNQKRFSQPVSFQGWELTESGYDLEETVTSLAKWGLRSYNRCFDTSNHWSAHWNFLACQARFQPGIVFEEEVKGFIKIDDYEHSLTFYGKNLTFGHLPREQCDFVLEAEGHEFAALFAAQDRKKAIEASNISISGNMEAFAKSMACFI